MRDAAKNTKQDEKPGVRVFLLKWNMTIITKSSITNVTFEKYRDCNYFRPCPQSKDHEDHDDHHTALPPMSSSDASE